MKKQMEIKDRVSNETYSVKLYFSDTTEELEKSEISLLEEPNTSVTIKGYALSIESGKLIVAKTLKNPFEGCFKKSKAVSAVLQMIDSELLAIMAEFKVHQSHELRNKDIDETINRVFSVLADYIITRPNKVKIVADVISYYSQDI